MHILIADKFEDSGVKDLKDQGLKVTLDANLDGDSLTKALKEINPDVLVVRSTKVKEDMLKACEKLSLVIRAGAGVNTIDLENASKLGIFVANCPGKNSVAVAELTMGLLMSIDRRIAENANDLRQGKWNKKEYSKAEGLKGKIFGLIGLGNIGKEVVQRAQGFEMPIIAWSRSLTDELANKMKIKKCSSPLEVAKKADIVSIHVALTPETKNLCNEKFFSSMKKGAYFINTSRAEVVDEKALIKVMDEKGIKAGLDVFMDEPSSKDCDWQTNLTKHPSVTGTHHIGASTNQAQQAIAEETVRIIKTYASEGVVLNCVNLDQDPVNACTLTIRHLNQVGVLAKVLGAIQAEDINVLEMENTLFSGDQAAIAKISLGKIPSKNLLDQVRKSNDAIISINLIHSGEN